MKNTNNLAGRVKEKFAQTLLVVQGPGFRCMAYRDSHGMLRNFWDQKILPLPIHILDPEN